MPEFRVCQEPHFAPDEIDLGEFSLQSFHARKQMCPGRKTVSSRVLWGEHLQVSLWSRSKFARSIMSLVVRCLQSQFSGGMRSKWKLGRFCLEPRIVHPGYD